MNDHRYYCEFWSGYSRDGVVINGDGYHYYRMSKEGEILEALEAGKYDLESFEVCIREMEKGSDGVFEFLDAILREK